MVDTDLLTPKQAAEMLGMTAHQVYRRIHSGALPAVSGSERNSQYLLDPADVQAYIAAGQPEWTNTGGPMMRVPEVAKLTGFTDETVRRMCYEGVFSYVRGSGERGHLRIHRASVDDYLAGVPARSR